MTAYNLIGDKQPIILSNKQNLVSDVQLLVTAVTPARRVGRLNRTALRHR